MNGFIDYYSEFMQVKLMSNLVNEIFLPFKLSKIFLLKNEKIFESGLFKTRF